MKEEQITRANEIIRELDRVRMKKRFIEDYKKGKQTDVSIETNVIPATLADTNSSEDDRFAIRKFLDDIYDIALKEERKLLEELENL